MNNREKLVTVRRYVNEHGVHSYSSRTTIIGINYSGVFLKSLDGLQYKITLDEFCIAFDLK